MKAAAQLPTVRTRSYALCIMPLDLGKVRKPIRELRKSLKILPGDPSVKAVHNLRTSSRKLEAIAIALAPRDWRSTHRLLNTIKPLRKAAGSVRDMDVLAAKAQRLYAICDRGSVDRLLQRLHSMRIASAHTLLDELDARRKHTRHSLERIANQLKRTARNTDQYARELRRLIHELMHWPALDANNLHDFRIRVKETRYVLQLVPNSDSNFLRVLDAVKSRIGDWHDWQQLTAIACEVLNRQKDRKTLQSIADTEKDKLKRALKAAVTFRARYLGGQSALPHAEA